MKVTIEAGTRGWFEAKFHDVAFMTFERDTIVDVEPFKTYWYRVKGQIMDLPVGHPEVLINEVYVSKECANLVGGQSRSRSARK